MVAIYDHGCDPRDNEHANNGKAQAIEIVITVADWSLRTSRHSLFHLPLRRTGDAFFITAPRMGFKLRMARVLFSSNFRWPFSDLVPLTGDVRSYG